MLKQKIIFFFLLAASGGQVASAMTLKDAFGAALEKNENVPLQEEQSYQAEETVSQAWGSIVPQLNFKTQWGWQEPTSTNSGWSPSTALSATQPLFQGYREWYGLDRAKHQLRQQRITKDAVELQLYKDLVSAFYDILALERDLDNLTEETGFLKDRIKELERWRHIGRAQSTDVLTAKTQLATLLVTIEKDRQELKVARESFSRITDLPSDVELVDHLHHFHPTLEPIDNYLRKIADRPDVRASKEDVSASENFIKIAKADHLPSLSLTADKYFLRTGKETDIGWDAFLVLTIPIYSGGVTQSKVRQAYSQSHQSQLRLSQAERSADQEIRQFYDQAASDIKLLTLNKENLDLAEQTFKEEQKFFRNGLVTNLEVLTALTSYIETKRALDGNRFNLRAHYLSLQAAISANKSAL